MTRRSLLGLVAAAWAACTGHVATAVSPTEHAVIVHFDNYGSKNLDVLFALETRLEAAIKAAHVGEYDGNEIATDGTDGTLYMYGPDADKLFAVVKPILVATKFTSRARVVLRYGPAGKGVREVTVQLGTG